MKIGEARMICGNQRDPVLRFFSVFSEKSGFPGDGSYSLEGSVND